MILDDEADHVGHAEDEEKAGPVQDVRTAELRLMPGFAGFLGRIASLGVEVRGSSPVPLSERTNDRTINLFTVWFSMSLNLLP